ncbi:MAG: 4-(cytidine 5'-diphospho)-2-C-methyl-D-erythritol kinase [bacterium JZ-2024 1]
MHRQCANLPAGCFCVKIRVSAKVNLFLQVKKRQNSLHPIESLMHRITLSDELIFEKKKERKIQVYCEGEFVPDGETRIFRALQYIQKKEEVAFGMTVWVKKGIPSGSGLGGGSADAFAALLAASELWQAKIPPPEEIVFHLGSDIPFFFSESGCAWISGCGELVEPMPSLPPFPALILYPETPITSAEAYQWWDEIGREKGSDISLVKECVRKREWEKLWDLCQNDLEEVVLEKKPFLRAFVEITRQTKPLFLRMTGSGSAFFALYPEEESALRAFFEISRKNVCRVLWSHLTEKGVCKE